MKAPDYLLQRFRPGSWVMAIGDVWRVVECLPDELVRLARPGEVLRDLHISCIQEVSGVSRWQHRLKPFNEYPENKQAVALIRREHIDACLRDGWSLESIEEIAQKWDLSNKTVMRYVDRYIQSGHLVVTLIPGVFRFGLRHRSISNEVRAVLATAASKFWFVEERGPEVTMLEWIETVCRAQNLDKPARSTVRRYIAQQTDPRSLSKREGTKAVREKYEPLAGKAPTGRRPFGKIEMDHTPLNILIRLPSGKTERAWLTIAIDLYTRMIVGLYISLCDPSRYSSGMCLFRMMTDKSPWLLSHGINASWPSIGVPEVIQTDSGKDFLSHDFVRIALENNIKLMTRRAGRAEDGGIVERWMGKAARIVEILPGKTFASISKKGSYKPEEWAVLTLEEIEKYFLLYVVEEYNNLPHKGLRGRTPISVFNNWFKENAGNNEFPKQVQQAPSELLYSLLPSFEATIQQNGATYKGILYFDLCFAPWICRKSPDSASGKHRFHYDLSHARTVFWKDPDTGAWHSIRTQDLTTPDSPMWELQDLLYADAEAAKLTVDMTPVDRGRSARYEMQERAKADSTANQKAKQSSKRNKQCKNKQNHNSASIKNEPRDASSPSIDTQEGFEDAMPDFALLSELPHWDGEYLELQ